MSSQSLTSALVVAIILISSVLASGQTRPSAPAAATAPAAKTTPAAETWTPPKTPWGDPDLQGIYTSDDYMDTPLERLLSRVSRFVAHPPIRSRGTFGITSRM